MAENNDAREERREYVHRRQTIVFAVVGAVLVVALFISSLFLFHVGGLGEVKTTAEGADHGVVAPCVSPAEDGSKPKYLDSKSVTTRVLNGTKFSGFANAVGRALQNREFVVQSIDNYDNAKVERTTIVFGKNAIPQAYTLAANFPDAQLQMDDRQDKLVDVILGATFQNLTKTDELPKTGQVNPYAFSQAIAEAREAGDEAVIITVGAKLSGTNQSARTALAEAPGGDVFVVDSNNVTLGERVLVEYALRLVDEGRSASQIAAAVEAVRDRVVVIGLLETLEYLVRGGRLSAAAGAVGTLLNVKPVVAAEDGLIVQLGKARGSKNGRNLLNQKVEQAGGVDFSMPLALGYTGLSDAVLKKYIDDSAALWAGHTEGELPVHTIGATIGTHVGPGAVAVAFFQPAN